MDPEVTTPAQSAEEAPAAPSPEEQARFREEFRATLLAELPDDPRNPMFCQALSANILDHLGPDKTAPDLNAHGQPAAVPVGINPVSWDELTILRSNLEYEHDIPADMAEKLFPEPKRISPAQGIIDASYRLASGVTRHNDAVGYSFRLGPALQCVDVPIFTVPGVNWSIGDAAILMQPLVPGNVGARIPLVGGFYLQGRELSEDAQRATGVAGVAFQGPNYDPAKPPNFDQNDLVLARYPMFLHGGRSVVLPGISLIPMEKSAHGGFRLVTDPARLRECLEDPKKAEARSFVVKHSIATQYIGVGLRRYVYHAAAQDENGRVDLQPGEIIIDISGRGTLGGGTAAMVQRTANAGASGIFLDMKHQPGGSAPTVEFALLMERDHGEYKDEHREAYLAQVNRVVGHNLAVCCRLDLTIDGHQPTADNLSIYGRITDAENFRKAETPYQIMPLVLGWLRDMEELAQAGGYPKNDYFSSPHLATLVHEALPARRAEAVILQLGPKPTDPMIAAAVLCAEMIEARFESEGLGLPLNELWREYCRSGLFREIITSGCPAPAGGHAAAPGKPRQATPLQKKIAERRRRRARRERRQGPGQDPA